LHIAYISDQKTKSVYFKLRPLPPLSNATAEYCLHIFLFLGSEGAWHSGPPPPYASGNIHTTNNTEKACGPQKFYSRACSWTTLA